jgi:predicted TIM-barrel fold metal-dependent hydrolase
MDIQGIDVAALFPGFSLRASGWIEDPDLACAVAKAYNNWLRDYCKVAPARLKGLAVLPLRDVTESVRELRRAVTTLGFVGVAFPPGALNKAVSDDYFHPIFEAAEELHVPIMFHAGSLRIPGIERFDHQYLPAHTLSHPYEQMVALMCTMYGGLLEQFPSLNFAYVEAGAGWLPFWIERIAEHYERRAREVPRMKHSPQEYLRSGRIFVTCEADESTLESVVQLCGEDVVLYASDYPHWDSQFDAVQELRNRESISDAVKTKILNGNAKRLFGSALESTEKSHA